MAISKKDDKDNPPPKSLAEEIEYDKQMSVPFTGLESADLSDWSQEGEATSPSKFLEYSQQELEDLRRSSMGGVKSDPGTPNSQPMQSTPVVPLPKNAAVVGTNIPKFGFLQRTKPTKRNDVTPPGSSQDQKKSKAPQDS